MIYTSQSGFKGLNLNTDIYDFDLDEPATFVLVLADKTLLYVRKLAKSDNPYAFSFLGALSTNGTKKDVAGVLSTSKDTDVSKRVWIQAIIL